MKKSNLLPKFAILTKLNSLKKTSILKDILNRHLLFFIPFILWSSLSHAKTEELCLNKAKSGVFHQSLQIGVILDKSIKDLQPLLESFCQNIQQQFSGKFLVEVIYSNNFEQHKSQYIQIQDTLKDYHLLIAVEPNNAEKILRLEQTPPVLILMTSKIEVDLFLQKYPHKKSLLHSLYKDQPLSRKIDLIKTILPKVKTVGLLLGPVSKFEKASIEKVFQQKELELVSNIVDNTEATFSRLNYIIPQSDVILAIDDPYIFSPDTIRNILFAMQQKNIPFIANQKSLTQLGALMSIYTPYQDIGKQAADIALKIINNGNQTNNYLAYTSKFEVEQNPFIFDKFNLENKSNQEIIQLINEAEQNSKEQF